MKRISNKQSRKNIARRKRKVAARHAKAGHWHDRPRPMFNTGTVRYEVGATTDATNFGGIAAVHRLVTKLGLAETIDAELELLKIHLPYHESDHVLNPLTLHKPGLKRVLSVRPPSEARRRNATGRFRPWDWG